MPVSVCCISPALSEPLTQGHICWWGWWDWGESGESRGLCQPCHLCKIP